MADYWEQVKAKILSDSTVFEMETWTQEDGLRTEVSARVDQDFHIAICFCLHYRDRESSRNMAALIIEALEFLRNANTEEA